MDSRLEAIRDRIELLANVDRDRLVFGANTHDYALRATLSEAELIELDTQFGELPGEYRAILRDLSATGAGPYYGLLAPSIPEDAQGGSPDPKRQFRCTEETDYVAGTATSHLLDGTIVLADQGCGGRSLLVIRGPARGQVWSDWTSEEGGTVGPEATSVYVWFEQWLDRAFLEWIEHAAPRIAVEGPEDPDELEAVASVFELVERMSPGNQQLSRTLGYLHLREGRWDDASAAFDAAATTAGKEPEARRYLDRARLALVKGEHSAAIREAERGLAAPGVWYATRDELQHVMELALSGSGRADEALAVLDARAAEAQFSFSLHHRLARERLARGDLHGAGAALERAAAKANILGSASTLEERLSASFDPIIGELRAARREKDARALATLAERIRDAN